MWPDVVMVPEIEIDTDNHHYFCSARRDTWGSGWKENELFCHGYIETPGPSLFQEFTIIPHVPRCSHGSRNRNRHRQPPLFLLSSTRYIGSGWKENELFCHGIHWDSGTLTFSRIYHYSCMWPKLSRGVEDWNRHRQPPLFLLSSTRYIGSGWKENELFCHGIHWDSGTLTFSRIYHYSCMWPKLSRGVEDWNRHRQPPLFLLSSTRYMRVRLKREWVVLSWDDFDTPGPSLFQEFTLIPACAQM